MKKILTTLLLIFGFVTYSKNDIKILVNKNENISNEYIMSNNIEIEKVSKKASSKSTKEIVSKIVPKVPNLENIIDFRQKMIELMNIYENEVEHKIEYIAYSSKNRVNVRFETKSVNITLDLESLMNKVLENKSNVDTVNKIENSNLTREQKIKKAFYFLFDKIFENFRNEMLELKKSGEFIYNSEYVSLIKKNGKWEALEIIGKEKSNLDFEILVNKDISFNNKELEKIEKEISKIISPHLLDNSINKDTIINSYGITEKEYEKYFAKDIDRLKKLSTNTKKSIYFIDKENIVVKYENKNIDFLSDLQNIYSEPGFREGLHKIKDSNKDQRTKKLESRIYIFKKLYGDKNIEKLKKENKYIYGDIYINVEKINGVWTIKDSDLVK
ncbi:hypothetical protein [Oceanivirga salmonicida]|uniref:hypothetical protein n=1 Tax=Oceanivirga salmonicida TaxID=1769291 RepID=UPI0012E2C2CE|nr:hypothetical protein [Oceanivirga salmonicida]